MCSIKTCTYCGNILKTGQKKFCSTSCAAKFNNKLRVISDTTKKKISNALKQRYGIRKEFIERQCKICGCIFKVFRNKHGRFYKSTVCSDKCRHQLMIQAGHTAYAKSKDAGTNKPWTSRKISSYAEKFFETVLNNNNISYIREFYVGKLGYFLDFKINIKEYIIDLEIDGKQHKRMSEHDEKRDFQLKELGYIVYRIPWNDINTESGKIEMKNKIDTFLTFISNLNRVVE